MRELRRSTSSVMNPAISLAIAFSAGTLRASNSAEDFMVPSGLRSSCARPAVNCPSAARRSERRTSAWASCRLEFAAASCCAVSCSLRASSRFWAAS